MALIVALALALATFREPSQPRTSLAFALTLAILMGASMRGLLARSPAARFWWSGFGLFGWAHLLLIGSEWREMMPTNWLIDQLAKWAITDRLPFPTRGPGYTNEMHEANGRIWKAGVRLVTLYLTLMIALVGGILTGWLAARSGQAGSSRKEP